MLTIMNHMANQVEVRLISYFAIYLSIVVLVLQLTNPFLALAFQIYSGRQTQHYSNYKRTDFVRLAIYGFLLSTSSLLLGLFAF